MQIQDARYYLNTTTEQYDYLIFDAFNGDTIPCYLLSYEAVTLFQKRMTKAGVLGINIIGSLKRELFMTASVVRTLALVFDQVEIYPTFAPDGGDGSGNLVIVAYEGDKRAINWQSFRQYPVDRYAFDSVWSVMGSQYKFPESTQNFMMINQRCPGLFI